MFLLGFQSVVVFCKAKCHGVIVRVGDCEGTWGFRVSGVKKQGDLYSKMSVMSEDIQVCSVLVSVWSGIRG